MNTYETVTEAINDLTKKGYSANFNLPLLRESLPEYERNNLNANDFDIDAVYRFEGVSDPADETILFAISSKRFALKGILINAYGMYEDTETYELVKSLQLRHFNDASK